MASVDPVVPPGEPGRDEGLDTSRPASGGGWWTSGAEKDAHLAALRGVFGDAVVETMRRDMALHEDPRPLTDREREVLREAAAPVLRDIAASGAIGLDLREEARADRGDEIVYAWMSGPDGITGVDIWVAVGSSAAERVAGLAEQLQEWEVEELCSAGRSATWPECPEHPNSHPLEPVVEEEGSGAVWRCPRSGDVICAIGALGTHG
jgi:hypothetical protein